MLKSDILTGVLRINDTGDFVGIFGSFGQPNQALVNIGGTSTVISIPGAFDNLGVGINNSNRLVEEYGDSNLQNHGFIQRPDGTLRFPIDFPGSTSTVLAGINDRGWIVGRYMDASGRDHGLFRKNANTNVSFDFPNEATLRLNPKAC